MGGNYSKEEITQRRIPAIRGNTLLLLLIILILYLMTWSYNNSVSDHSHSFLDDLVIRQLRDENEKLRFEMQMLREITDQDNSATEEMTVILRDRINDLLLANADLEKEGVKLKYTAPPIFLQERYFPHSHCLKYKKCMDQN